MQVTFPLRDVSRKNLTIKVALVSHKNLISKDLSLNVLIKTYIRILKYYLMLFQHLFLVL